MTLEDDVAELTIELAALAESMVKHGFQHGIEGSDPMETPNQTKSTAGAPTHAASASTICLVIPDEAAYINIDGSTGWKQLEVGGAGAPTGVDYLVGQANASLTAEIVVGTTPQGQLGGTWPSPTVDAIHGGASPTAHFAKYTDSEARAAQKYVIVLPMGDDEVGILHTP